MDGCDVLPAPYLISLTTISLYHQYKIGNGLGVALTAWITHVGPMWAANRSSTGKYGLQPFMAHIGLIRRPWADSA